MEAKGKPPGDEHWKARYKEPAAPDTSDLPPLPEGWAWATVERLAEQIVDCPHSTPQYGNGDHYAIDTTCMAPGRVMTDRLRIVTRHTYEERIKRLKPQGGDVVLAREGTVGTACVLPPEPPVCLGQRVMLVRPGKLVKSSYLAHALMSPSTVLRYRGLLTGSTVSHLNVRDAVRLAVPIPPAAEQQRIVEELDRRLGNAEALGQGLAADLARAARLRQAVLKFAFEGKLVSQDPNDEPASVLLERIRAERKESPPRRARNRGGRRPVT